MIIKATFPAGVNEIVVHGLHQWDYGRKLKITSPDLSEETLIEVHFAHTGLKEAVVRSCETVNGAAVVTIPDRCLEQETSVFAWVYVFGENSGKTTKTVTLPITKRPRPQACEDIPVEISDKYAEAVTAMNSAVVRLTAKVDETENSASEKLAEMNAVMGEKITELTEVSDQKIGDLANMMNAQYEELAGQLESPKKYPETQLFYTGYYYISLELSIGAVGNVIFHDPEDIDGTKDYLIATTYDGSSYYARVTRFGETSIIRQYKSGSNTSYDEIHDFKIAFLWDPGIMGGDIV